jgi:tetratricopeptide (TPR) repeat protein
MKVIAPIAATLLIALAPLGGSSLGVGGAALAAEDQHSELPTKTRRVPTMTERSYKKLADAQEALDEKNTNQALSILNDMLNMKGLNGNELGQVHNMLAFIYFSKEDYPKTIREYEQVLAQGEDIPEGLEVGTLYSLAQLYFVTDQYQKSLEYMRRWLAKATNPGPEPHVFMGQVYYQLKDYPNAIVEIRKGIQIAQERGTAVKENWWQLLQYLYYQKEDWPKCIEVLEILVRDFPKREYWLQLAGMYGQQGNEKKQLLAMEAADAGNFLTRSSDITTYAGLLMQANLSYLAGKALQKGLNDKVVEATAKNYQSLGQAWQLAQEVDKAIAAYEQAGAKSDDGEIYSRLSQLYLDKDQYGKCIDTADKALQKGGLHKKQTTYLVRGMCYFNENRLSDARKSFQEAARTARGANDKSTERTSSQWINYIDKEKIRQDQIKASI